MKKMTYVRCMALAIAGALILGPVTPTAAVTDGTVVTELAGASPSLPAAEVTVTQFNFDPVPEGTRVSHDYIIRNRGEGVLKIHQVRTG